QLDWRAASEADIPFLLALRQETMDAHLAASGVECSDESRRERVLHHFDEAKILTERGTPIGLLKVRRARDEWEIVQIQLSGRFQGKGLGRRVLEEVLDGAAVAGARVRLSVLKANPARKLYERLGFEVVGEDAHEYFMVRPA